MSSANFQSIAPSHSHIKSLRQVEAPQTPQVQTKALGGAGNSELASWYEQAYAYYNSVMAGQTDRPADADWNEFLNQMNWAYQQLMGVSGTPSWDPNSIYGSDVQMVGDGYSAGSYSPSDPFGGIPGTNGQWVHNQEEAHVGFLGNQNRDIWSNDVTIDVAPLSGRVEVVKVQDESVQPPVEVIKVIVTDAATGTQDVYKIYDFDDADIKIRAADPGAVSGADELGIDVKKFKENQAGQGSSQSSIEGEPDPDGRDNYWIYEGRVGQYAEFTPEGSGEAGEEEFHEIYGNARIITRPSDHVMVSKGMPDEPDGYTVTVTHRDGSIDTYYIHKGFDVDLNAMPEYTTWSDGSVAVEDLVEGESEDVPSEFADHFTLNGGNTSSSSDFAANGGTQPDDIEEEEVTFSGVTETYRTAIYNNPQNQDVTINANLEDDVGQHKVFAPGVVTINPSSYSQNITVTKSGDTYRIIISDGSKSETIEVTGASQIIVNGLETNVDLRPLGEDDDVVRVGVDGTTNANQTNSEDPAIGGSSDWPATPAVLHGFVPNTAPNDTETRTLISWILDAIESGDWHRVHANIVSYDPDVGNNIIRNFISALYGYAGTRAAMMELLNKIPESVRQAMISKVQEQGDQLDERTNSLFSSSETASLLQESLTSSSSSED